MANMPNSESLLQPLKRLHETIRQTVIDSCERLSLESLSAIARDEEGDTIYAIDYLTEDLLIDFFTREIASLTPIVLIAEGLPNGSLVLPQRAAEESAVWRIIVDPIDGTRGLMYQKRSAWILTGVAPNRGAGTNLSDIELAIQTEIPLVKQHLCDTAWAFRGQGAHAERFNRLTKQTTGSTAALACRKHSAWVCRNRPLLSRRPRGTCGHRRRGGFWCARRRSARKGPLF